MLVRSLTFIVSTLIAVAGALGAQPGDTPNVTISAKASRSSVAPGDQIAIAVVFDHAPGWHTNTNEPVIPKELGDFPAVPTEIVIHSVTGARAGPIQWPPVHQVPVNFGGPGRPVLYGVFEGRAVAYIPLVIDPQAAGAVSLSIGVGYQMCDDTQCLMPVFPTDPESQFTVSIPVSAAEAPPPDPDFNSFDPAVFAAMHEGAAPQPVLPAPKPAGTPATSEATRNFLGFVHVPSPDSAAGLVVIALLAALGGLVLNLTPCVLPVVPIKIMTISHHAGTPGKALYLGLAMAAGVVAFWFGLGLIAVLVLGVTDPSVIFGIWWVTLGIGLLIGVMALGLMGLFTFNLPQRVYLLNPRADNAWGSFLFGVMTAVLGLPCFGFVAGALLAGSATMPQSVVLTIFASLGVGMGAPYLVLSAFPKLLDKIPRTGPASELVKQVMGLLLLAAAAFFAIIGLRTLIKERPHLGGVIEWWAVGLCVASAGLWLAYRTIRISSRTANRAAFGLVGLVLAASGIGVAVSFDRSEYERWVRSGPSDAQQELGGAWVRYTPERFAEIRGQGRIVVVDFTADWCLTCKTIEATVLDTATVRAAFAAPDVATMKADLTSREDPGWAFLKKLGRVGIPLLVVFRPGEEEPVFASNAYTPDMLVQAIESVRSDMGRESASLAPPTQPR